MPAARCSRLGQTALFSGILLVDAAGCERVAKHSAVVSFTILELHAGAGRRMDNDDRLLLHGAIAQNFHYPRWFMNDLHIICSSTLDTPLLQHMRQILMLTRRNIDGGATLMRFMRRSGVPRVPYHGASPPKLATTSGPPASSGQTWTKGSVAASEQRCSRVLASHGQPRVPQDEASAEDGRHEVSSFTVRKNHARTDMCIDFPAANFSSETFSLHICSQLIFSQ